LAVELRRQTAFLSLDNSSDPGDTCCRALTVENIMISLLAFVCQCFAKKNSNAQ
jgi:hypothetical protein